MDSNPMKEDVPLWRWRHIYLPWNLKALVERFPEEVVQDPIVRQWVKLEANHKYGAQQALGNNVGLDQVVLIVQRIVELAVNKPGSTANTTSYVSGSQEAGMGTLDTTRYLSRVPRSRLLRPFWRLVQRITHLVTESQASTFETQDFYSRGTAWSDSGSGSPCDPIYSPLRFRDAASQIRLVELLPGPEDSPIVARVFVSQRANSSGYSALSYVWGSRDADVSITLNGEPFDVSANLAEALRCLRHKDTPRTMWVDAICINQSDNTEKGAQVAIMGDIYRGATEVLIFLGGEAEGSNLVMDYLQHRADEVALDADGPTPRDMPQGDKQQYVLSRIQRCGLNQDDFFRAAYAFFTRPWWSRVWVVQEFALASREPQWYCGRHSASTSLLRREIPPVLNCLRRRCSGQEQFTIDEPLEAIRANEVVMPRAGHNVGLFLDSAPTSWTNRLPFSVMLRMHYRESTNPRDRVYAMREMLDSVSKRLFPPDYSIPVEELFFAWTSYMFLFQDDAGYFFGSYHLMRPSQPGIPSWAMDFTKPISPGEVLPRRQGWADKDSCLSVARRVLGAPGVILDDIELAAFLDGGNAGGLTSRLASLWRAERLLTHSHPRRAMLQMPDSLVPKCVLTPFTFVSRPTVIEADDKKPFRLVKMMSFFRTFFLGLTKNAAYALSRSRLQLEHLTCDQWVNLMSSSPAHFNLCFNRVLEATLESESPEAFYGEACFDYDNLKAQIFGVQYGDDSDASTAQGEAADLAHLKRVLRQAANEVELRQLQGYAIGIANRCREVFKAQLAGNDITQSGVVLGQEAREMVAATASAHRDILARCSCTGENRYHHQAFVKDMVERIERTQAQLDANPLPVVVGAVWEQLKAMVRKAHVLLGSMPQWTAVFTTVRGFGGFTLQQQARIKKGAMVALLEGITTPVVLERVADGGGRCRMDAPCNVFGLERVDVDGLIELGLCSLEEFKIV